MNKKITKYKKLLKAVCFFYNGTEKIQISLNLLHRKLLYALLYVHFIIFKIIVSIYMRKYICECFRFIIGFCVVLVNILQSCILEKTLSNKIFKIRIEKVYFTVSTNMKNEISVLVPMFFDRNVF